MSRTRLFDTTVAFYASRASEIGTHIVCGRGTDALELARQFPESITYSTKVIGPFGIRVHNRTPLQLAAVFGNDKLVSELRKLADRLTASPTFEEIMAAADDDPEAEYEDFDWRASIKRSAAARRPEEPRTYDEEIAAELEELELDDDSKQDLTTSSSAPTRRR